MTAFPIIRSLQNILRQPQPDYMPAFASKSGAGMEVGTTGNGTAKTVSGADTSSNNLDNTA